MQVYPWRASWVGDSRCFANLDFRLFELARELVPRATEVFLQVLDALVVSVEDIGQDLATLAGRRGACAATYSLSRSCASSAAC